MEPSATPLDRLETEIADATAHERRRLGDALHDNALQHVVLAKQEVIEAQQGDLDALPYAATALDEAMTAIRELTSSMRADSVTRLPLAEAIPRLAAEAERRGGIATHVTVADETTGLHDELLVGMVRELLVNVVKHAEAGAARVSVRRDGDRVVLSVVDDGRGVAEGAIATAAAAGHVGLARLREQVDGLGGDVRVDSSAGRGTLVTVSMPVAALEAQRRAGEVARHERQWSGALLAALQDGLMVFRDRRVVQVNDRLCDMTGFTREELIASPAGEAPFWPPELWGPRGDILAALKHSDGIDVEITLRRKDGSEFPALAAARPVRNGQGLSVGALVTAKDITAREQSERRARLERELAGARRSTRALGDVLAQARLVRSPADLQDLLDRIARVVCEELGWAVVVNIQRPAWGDVVVRAMHGLDAEAVRTLTGASYPQDQWDEWLVPEHERRGAYFVPAGGASDELLQGAGPVYIPDMEKRDVPDAWDPMDMLLVPVRAADGRNIGFLSLDTPVHGRRPDDAELDVLAAVGAHIGVALERVAETRTDERRDLVRGMLARLAREAAIPAAGDRPAAIVGELAGALGVGRVVLDVAVPGTGAQRLRTAVGIAPSELATDVSFDAAAMSRLLDAEAVRVGYRLLTHREAVTLVPAERIALATGRTNGEGPQAWIDHVLVVPVPGPGTRPAGLLWLQDPLDRLLPDRPWLEALVAVAGLIGVALAGKSSAS